MQEPKNKHGLTESEFLASYDPSQYDRPSVTVDMAIFTADRDGLSVLLVQRGDHPFLHSWALPGGFLNMDEDLTAAASRELFEETGLDDLPLIPLGAFGAVDRDPRTRIVTAAFLGLSPANTLRPQAGDDAARAELFRVTLEVRGENERIISLSGPAHLRLFAAIGTNGLASAVSRAAGDLASDHSLILACAIHHLARHQNRAASLLSGGDPAFYKSLVRQFTLWRPQDD